MQRELAVKKIENFCRMLREFKFFFVGTKTIKEDIDQLADFTSSLMPVKIMSFIRMDTEYRISESAHWSENDCYSDAFFASLELKYYGAVQKMYDRGGMPEDSALEEMLGCLDISPVPDFYPTAFPIINDSVLLGFAFFGKDCAEGRWSGEEKKLLNMLVTILGIAFANDRTKELHSLYSFVFEAMMDSIHSSVYITDVETDEILFMNREMKSQFHLKAPEGKVCWRVLQRGMTKRCEFCPVKLLLEDKSDRPSFKWEEVNSVTGRTYENYDSLIQWTDGRLVHLQHSIDITDVKVLSRSANTDAMTGVLNRRAGERALEELMKRGKTEHSLVTVCLYDVNMLKEINDNFGHLAGDKAICRVADSVREQMEEPDFLFRLSSDEFMAVFYNCSRVNAERKMREVSKRLGEEEEKGGLPYELSFSYGMLELDWGQPLPFLDILNRADEKMYEQKRRFHVLQAERKNAKKTKEMHTLKEFTYNSDLLYSALVDSTDDYLYVCNMKTNTFRYPKAMVEEFDLPEEIIENAAAVWGARVHERDKMAFLESNQEITDGRTQSHCVEYRAKNRKGEWVWLRCRGHLELDQDGEPELFAGFITNLGKKNKIDHMTGLFNKLVFEEEIKRQMENRPSDSIGIMVFGIDDFRHVNDLYDRSFGDEVIRITSQKMQAFLPHNASIYRLDSDEFGVVMPNAEKKDLQKYYNAIRNEFKYQQEYDGKKYYCTLSAGCVFYPEDGTQYALLMKYAGYSLEFSKSSGKNCVTFFSKNILLKKERSLEITELLRESLENNFKDFKLYYQPQVRASDGKIIGAEALARWSCPKYGAVSPMEFIPLLEESGLIIPVGKWLFEQAVKQCAEWVKIKPDFTMSINLSYLQLKDESFLQFIKELLGYEGIGAENIIVELTESYLAQSGSSVQSIFRELRQMGIRIAMDDFGTGYSSLEILKQSPSDIVKIDKTFIKDIKNSNFDATFIRFIVELCHDVNIRVCLEGVETQDEYTIVHSMNLDMIQGYLFGRPVSGMDFYRQYLKDV